MRKLRSTGRQRKGVKVNQGLDPVEKLQLCRQPKFSGDHPSIPEEKPTD